MAREPSIVVHGGAGEHLAENLGPARAACEEAARAGHELLRAGGSALDAVEAAVRVLEAAPCLNAGRGAVLDEDGRVVVDASLMSGAELRAGAVGALPNYLHPITVARRVLEDGRHVLLVAEGALRFARAHGLHPSLPDDLVVPRAVRRYVEELARTRPAFEQANPGTVGAVAFDARGQLAAGTSTGGVPSKRAGRLGDTPQLGAGTYADDLAGAASATGPGEPILRVALTHRVVSALGAAPDLTAEDAARDGLRYLEARLGAKAGLIVIDRQGRVGVAYSTPHMPFALVGRDGALQSGV